MQKLLLLLLIFSQSICANTSILYSSCTEKMIYEDKVNLNEGNRTTSRKNLYNKLEKIKISYHDNGRCGENVLWNLSNIDIDTANVEISHVYCNSTKDTRVVLKISNYE